MLSRRKYVIMMILALIIAAGIVVVIVQQSYTPKKEVTGPISVIDDLGRNVTIANYPPKRIISLAPSNTEILFALGLGQKVVGVDQYSDYPPEVQERVKAGNLTIVGSFVNINVETVIGLKPDLILAFGGVQRPIVERLEELGQTVVVLYPKSFEGVLHDIILVGKATGKVDEAKTLVANIQKKAQEIVNKTKDLYRPRVYLEYFSDGGYWTFAGDSYGNELIYMAGGINIFAGFQGTYISVSTEEIVKANPEIIIITKGRIKPEDIKNRPGWDKIYAVQHNKIYEIDENIISRPGPRLIEALEELAKIIHPELFTEKAILDGTEFTLNEELSKTIQLFNSFDIKPHLTTNDHIYVVHYFYMEQTNRPILNNFKLVDKNGIEIMAESLLILGLIKLDEIKRMVRLIADNNSFNRIEFHERMRFK